MKAATRGGLGIIAVAAAALFASLWLRARLGRTPETFIYIADAVGQNIAVFRLHEDGTLTPRQTVKVPGPDTPGASLPLAVSPDRRFLYVALRSAPYSVATFAIDSAQGTLSYVGSGPLADNMVYIATDHSGRFLLGASLAGDKVTVNPISRDGIVGTVQQVIPAPNAHAILPDATNRHVLYTSHGGDAVYQAQLDPVTGIMWPSQPPLVRVTDDAAPRHFVFSRDGRFVYVLGERDGAIHVFPYHDDTGMLAPELQRTSAQPLHVVANPRAADLHITPDGRYLYASERTSSTLAAFRIDEETGRLTRIGTYPTATQPCALAVDPHGRFLIVAGQGAAGVAVHAIDRTTGMLRKVAQAPAGDAPSWVEIVATRL